VAGIVTGTNRDPELVVDDSFAARAAASNRSRKISASMRPPRLRCTDGTLIRNPVKSCGQSDTARKKRIFRGALVWPGRDGIAARGGPRSIRVIAAAPLCTPGVSLRLCESAKEKGRPGGRPFHCRAVVRLNSCEHAV